MVADVAQARRQALRLPQRQAETELQQGRLLIYEPEINLAHGLSGIKVSPEECFRWLDTTDFTLRSLLAKSGLLDEQ